MIINKSLNQNNYDQCLSPLRLKKKVVCELLGGFRKSTLKNIIG